MKRSELRFPIASVFFIVYALHYIARFCASLEYYSITEIFITGLLPTVMMLAVPVLLGIMLVIKRRNIWLASVFILETAMQLIRYFDQSDLHAQVFGTFGYVANLVRARPSVFLAIGASVSMALLIFINCERKLIKADISKFVVTYNKFWFVPGLFNVAAIVAKIAQAMCDYSLSFKEIFIYLYWREFLVSPSCWQMIYSIGLFLLGYWVVNPYKKEKGASRKAEDNTVNNVVDDKAYCSMGKHIVLCLFTFGIWPLIWTYRTTRFLNKAPYAEQYNPTNKLLLCIFVPFYRIYWFYKHGQRIDALSQQKKLNNSDMATLCLILGIVIPVVAYIIMQDRINAICTTKAIAEEQKPENSVIDQLKQYKELLDSGVITQEEFDAKKKQLLGL